jgi:hypothetical protein
VKEFRNLKRAGAKEPAFQTGRAPPEKPPQATLPKGGVEKILFMFLIFSYHVFYK